MPPKSLVILDSSVSGIDGLQKRPIFLPMDEMETPEELQTPPEKRLIGTLITGKPDQKSLVVSALVVLFVTLISQVYWLDPWNLSNLMPAMQEAVFSQGQWWRIYTAILIHADMGHLLSNLYMLSILSFFIYGYFGLRVYPLLTFLGAGLVNALAILTYPEHVRLLGASGWVYLLGGFWLTLYFFIQRQYPWSRRLLRAMGIGLMIFFPTSFEPTTSYRTHFIGFVVGILMASLYFFKNRNQIQKHETFKMVG